MITRVLPIALSLCTAIAQAATPPTVSNVSPPPGTVSALTSVTVTFSAPVVGVNAEDLLINTQPASSVSGGADTYTFTFSQPLSGSASFSWFPDHGITDQADPPNSFDGTGPGATWQYTLVDTVPPTVINLFPADGATVRVLTQVEVTFSEEVTGVEAGDLLVNTQPATNVTRIPGGPYVFKFPSQAAGAVQFQWAAGNGITDQAPAPNPFAGPATAGWTVTLDPNLASSDVVISEILARNLSGLTSEFGQPEDWIELRNRGTTPVNLNGWSLSDDEALPGQWVFPAKVLQPGEYFIVFTSAIDRRVLGGTNRLHTNFRLSRSREFLGLFSADSPRALISGFTPGYPEQHNDDSYGYDPNGNLRYFATPTPGASNGFSTITGVSEPVHFSVQRGHYTQPFDLILTCPTPGAFIRYTHDGTEPTAATGLIYATPLRITNTTLLRAAAFRVNLLPSLTETHSYFFNLPAARLSLPVLSIVTATSNLVGRYGIIGMGGGRRTNDNLYVTNNPATDYHNPSAHGIAWERPVSAEYILPGDNSGFQIDCGIRVQGSDWQRPRLLPTSKFSFRLYFRGDYGPGRLEYPMFPLTTVQSFDQLVLRAGFNDQGPPEPFIRDETIRRMSHDMGQVASHGGFMNIFTNGSYAGYYNPTERVHEEFMQSHVGGGSEWDVIAPSFATGAEELGVVDGDRNEFNNFMNYVWSQQSATTITNPLIYREVARRLDLPNFVDYCLLNAYVAMGDWPANNWRAARERSTNGIWRFITWDAEWGMGIYALPVTRDSFAFSGTGTEDAGLNSTGNSEIARLYQRLRPNREFRLLWADRIRKHFFNGGALMGANISNRFNAQRAELSAVIPGMQTEILDWARDRNNIIMGQFNTYGLYGFSNSLYSVFASSNAPSFNQHGGRVVPGFSLTMTAPIAGSAIYYTTNGADPRVPFTGTISNAASLYAGAITLNQGILVRARALLNGSNWSAINEATFEVGRIGVPVRITEIHYNPSDGPGFEFVELENIGGAAVNLSGAYFEGINYIFGVGATLAPGAKIVLASDFDSNAFAQRYPGVTVFGFLSGGLNNAGERLALFDSGGNIVTSVDFDDAGGWPTTADGGGPSLEIIDPASDPDDPANWRASANAGGSPGATPSGSPLGNVRLNEALALNLSAVPNGTTFPDYVELHNAGASPADIGGWSLTDDPAGAGLRKFVFPTGTTVGAGGYLVVWCDDATNTTPGLHAGFSFGANGDNVFLHDLSTNRVDALSFGLQLADLSVGRVGSEWILNTPTPGTANNAAATGLTASLSINEWLANAAPGLPDWIELYNPAAQPVALRGISLATTSAVHQVTSLSFIAPNGFVQLFADEETGSDHLDFKLPAAGGSITLYDNTATEVNRINYTNAVESLARGRLPDGTTTLANFPGSASPGSSNYVNAYSGPVFNEVLARNQTAVTNAGRVADFVELFNGGASAFNLGGMSLSVNSQQSGEWIFAPTTFIPAGGYLVIWCDGSRAASTNGGDLLNTGESLDGESGGVYLFSSTGQLVNSVEYGFQITDRPIGLSGNQWNLLSAPTPVAANSANAILGNANGLRINEWMANPASGPDWFELYNTNNLPVAMNGLTLTDDPSSAGLGQFRVPPLSFIGPNGFAQWIADADPDQGRNHVTFSLDSGGETIRLYSTNGANFVLIDSISFASQLLNVSEGRLLDGETSIYAFPGSPTPSAPNAVLEPNIVINEILTHTDPPLEDAIELFNAGSAAINIGGWFLSPAGAGPDNFKKYRIADNTIIPAGGFVVFYEYQFGGVPPAGFTLNSAHGDEVWLSGADPITGRLTGYRTGAKFGAAANGVSFGRHETSVGVHYVASSQRTFGQDNPNSLSQFRTGTGLANALPLVGPVVINEIMYNPISGAEEYIELRNLTVAPMAFYDPNHPTNRWRLSGGIEFVFATNTTLAANGYLLVVDFDPAASPAALTAFRNRHGLAPTIPVLGPFNGRLGNEGDNVELHRPDAPQGPTAPDAGFVPYLVVDRVNYGDAAPWPYGLVDGGGLSLQRENSSAYGNEPLNWVAALPTPGAMNGAGIVPPPTITTPPQSQTVFEGAAAMLTVAASGDGPLAYQWRLNGTMLPDATNSSYALDYVVDTDEGLYDVLVGNSGGASLGGPAVLRVDVPPIVLLAPASQILRTNATASFTVVVRGDGPLRYQWRFNGLSLPGETNATLVRAGVQLPDDGVYDVMISNPVANTLASATLTVLVNPVLTVSPVPQTVVAGGLVSLSAAATGNPLPFSFEWRRGSFPLVTNVASRPYDFFNFTAPNMATSLSYRVIVRNLANTNPGVASGLVVVTVLADGDTDGIPDSWETTYGLNPGSNADRDLDSDGDGMSNYAEYIADTDPANAFSYLRVDLTAVPGAASVVFNAVSNKTYTVRYTDALGSGQWFRLRDVVAFSTNRIETIADSSWTTNRFYQLVTPVQP